MADDLTQMLNAGTAEERIMAWLDAMEARSNDCFARLEFRLGNVEQALSTLEAKVDHRLRKTRKVSQSSLKTGS